MRALFVLGAPLAAVLCGVLLANSRNEAGVASNAVVFGLALVLGGLLFAVLGFMVCEEQDGD